MKGGDVSKGIRSLLHWIEEREIRRVCETEYLGRYDGMLVASGRGARVALCPDFGSIATPNVPLDRSAKCQPLDVRSWARQMGHLMHRLL